MRYFFECTQTYTSGENTGIQRVVRNVLRSIAPAPASARVQDAAPVQFNKIVFEAGSFLPVASEISHPSRAKAGTSSAPPARSLLKATLRGSFHASRSALVFVFPGERFFDFVYASSSRWGLSKLCMLPLKFFSKGPKVPPEIPASSVTFTPGDVVVLLDPSFHLDFWPAIQKARREGAKIVVVIYDLIPERYPQFCQPGMVAAFRFWLKNVQTHADGIVTISHGVALDVAKKFEQGNGPHDPPLRMKSFRLGCELDGLSASSDSSDSALRTLLSSPVPAYAYVSTIEPRKNHAYALSAFELLWEQCVDAHFIIIGKIGWKSDRFMRRLANHPEFGKRVFLFQNVDDNDLAHVYQNARGLIFTSLIEGFGLPVVEAVTQGLPAFVSDIPVFREIDADGIQYVDLSAPESLAAALQEHAAAGAPRMANPAEWLSWRESSAELMAAVNSTITA